MEKHTCKLCFRHFSNGRALGGHMRSHVTGNTPPAPPAKAQPVHGSSSSSPSASASSSSLPEEEEEGKEAQAEAEAEAEAGLGYVLRENPRKSFRLVDPEFSSTFAAVDAASSVVQDRESETESSRAPAHRRRSKRQRRPPPEQPEPEPVSSVSDTTPEEDVALCLMMLSRDVWAAASKAKASSEEEQQQRQKSDGEDEAEEEDAEAEEDRIAAARSRRSKYQCGTCKKVFRSYQALGGHRASHKKMKGCIPAVQVQIQDADSSEANAANADGSGAAKVHECPICFRVFSSGQALGGHKRSHLTPSNTTTITITSPSLAPLPASTSSPVTAAKLGESLIDLNLPAPLDEDAELSAVSDAEFVLHHNPSN